ncbi:MAG: ribbon-helix-helix protein, CopG family [Methanomicrobiales archaeon]
MVESPNDTIRVRVGEELKQKIQSLVESGEYEDISAFVREAIREHLNPTRGIERTKRHIIYLVEKDIEIQEALSLAKGYR